MTEVPIRHDAPEKEAAWAIKDALIVIPFLASALALTWEVGFFLTIKGSAFGLFTISEHITFALQALPLAMLAAIFLGFGSLHSSLIRQYVLPKFIKSPEERVAFHRKLGFGGLTCGCLLLVLVAFGPLRYATVIVFGVLYVVLFTLITFAPHLLDRVRSISLLVVFAFTVTFSIGVDTARNELHSERPLNKIQTGDKGKSPETELSVRIVRAGERGVLYFDPATQQFTLLPWDQVKRIDWGISPLLMP